MGNIEPLRDPGTRVLIRKHNESEPERRISSHSRRSTDSLTKAGYELFEALRQLRFKIAGEEGMPAYIIFSDKTLVDMSIKVPRDKASMLAVSGVGIAKYEKYGERFIEAITIFFDNNPGAVTSIKDGEASLDNLVKSVKKRKSHKESFHLNPEDGEKFEYHDLYHISEIKDELNRITSADNVKHIFGTDVFKFLVSIGYVEEKQVDGKTVQVQTELGLSKGIASVERTSKTGTVYTVLMYPPVVQKEIVEHYVAAGRRA